METPNVKTLEGKLLQLEEYLKEKGCFGLSVSCEVCTICHLNGPCPEFVVERLVHEERQLEADERKLELEQEAARMMASGTETSVAEVIVEKPKRGRKKKEVHDVSHATAEDELAASLPKTRGGEWNWSVAISSVMSAKPTTYNATFKIIIDMLPEGTNPNKGYNYAWNLLTKLAERGIIEWDGAAQTPVIWK